MGSINSSFIYGSDKINIKRSGDSLDALVKEIVEVLINSKAELINDVENEKLPFSSLEQEIIKYIDGNKKVLSGYSREDLIENIKSYLFGYYQYQSFLDDPLVTNIHAIGKSHTLISKIDENGFEVVENTDKIKFDSDDSYIAFCDYVANRNNTEINIRKQIQVVTDKARCDDFILRIDITGREVNSPGVPLMVFAKTPKKKRSMNELKNMGMFNDDVEKYINDLAKAGCGVLLGGEGGAGKTNLINAALELIPFYRRTLVIQAAEELHSEKENIIFQRSREDLGETNISYGLKDLSLNASKMRINQLVLGELQGDEAFHFFNAGSSGHIVWASTHFARVEEALSRLLQLTQYSDVNMSEEQTLRMLASAIDSIFFLKDFKILNIAEVVGFDENTKKIIFNPVFEFDFNKGSWIRINESCDRIKEKISYARYRDGLRKGA